MAINAQQLDISHIVPCHKHLSAHRHIHTAVPKTEINIHEYNRKLNVQIILKKEQAMFITTSEKYHFMEPWITCYTATLIYSACILTKDYGSRDHSLGVWTEWWPDGPQSSAQPVSCLQRQCRFLTGRLDKTWSHLWNPRLLSANKITNAMQQIGNINCTVIIGSSIHK